jgi:hypothetical protein
LFLCLLQPSLLLQRHFSCHVLLAVISNIILSSWYSDADPVLPCCLICAGTLANKACNGIHWSPMGHNIVLSGLKALNGQLEFFNVDEFEVLAAAEHFMATGAMSFIISKTTAGRAGSVVAISCGQHVGQRFSGAGAAFFTAGRMLDSFTSLLLDGADLVASTLFV